MHSMKGVFMFDDTFFVILTVILLNLFCIFIWIFYITLIWSEYPKVSHKMKIGFNLFLLFSISFSSYSTDDNRFYLLGGLLLLLEIIVILIKEFTQMKLRYTKTFYHSYMQKK